MADVNRGNRPLSPHITIYRPQITSIISIMHRVTGVGLTLGATLVVWWLLAASTGPEYFATANWFLTSWFGGLIMIGSLWALWFHFCNGIRHLFWDVGAGFDLEVVTKSGIAVIAGSFGLTILTLIIAFFGGA